MGRTADWRIIATDAVRIMAGLARSRLFWALLVMDAGFLGLHMVMTGFDVMDTAPSSVDWARLDRDHEFSVNYRSQFTTQYACYLALRQCAVSETWDGCATEQKTEAEQ